MSQWKDYKKPVPEESEKKAAHPTPSAAERHSHENSVNESGNYSSRYGSIEPQSATTYKTSEQTRPTMPEHRTPDYRSYASEESPAHSSNPKSYRTPEQPSSAGQSYRTPEQPGRAGQSYRQPEQPSSAGQSYRQPEQPGRAGESYRTPDQPGRAGQSYRQPEPPPSTTYRIDPRTPEQPGRAGQSYRQPEPPPSTTYRIDPRTPEQPGGAGESSRAPGLATSTAERHSHINSIDEIVANRSARYGTIEQAQGGEKVFKTPDRSVFEGSIKDASVKIEGSIKDKKISDGSFKVTGAADAFAEKTWGKDKGESKGVAGAAKTALGIAGREIEAAVGRGGGSDALDDRSAGLAGKYGYKAGKYAALGGFAVTRGSFRLVRYGKKLSSDVKAGSKTGKEAAKALFSREKGSVAGSAKSVGKIAAGGMAHAVADFHGSDDIGVKAVVAPKDAVVKVNRTVKLTKGVGRSLTKGAQNLKKAATKVQQAGKAVFAFGKKIFTNPVVLKGAAIVALVVVIIAVIMSVVSSVVGIVPSLSLKSEDWELTQAYLYVTELDARMEYDIRTEDTRLHIPSIDEYHYYLNGVEVTKTQMRVFTNADLLLAFFDSKYEDYSFDGIIAGLFGTTVKSEIAGIHEELHSVTKTRWSYEIEHGDSDPDDDVDDSWTETVYVMDISLSTMTLESYIEDNKDTLLTPDQQEALAAVLEVGVYTFRQELGSPFVDVDWSAYVSSRWGWRIHPISGELKKHLGLDIAMPGGTPINAVMAGTVSVPAFDGDGFGNYVIVTDANGNYTIYAHMRSVAVTNGQIVSPGDVLGYVGTTGSSTGDHLHIEYHKDGKSLCPLIFLYCEE